jgi:alpha-L-fucosidase
VVREFVDAVTAAGLKVGLYLSPRDQHYPSSSAGYEVYFRNLITELLTGYGPVDEILFEGDNAPQSVDWAGIVRLAKTLQPDILVWMGPEIATTGVDLRWIGSAQSSRTASSIANIPNGGPTGAWYPADVHISVRSPDWFWHPGDSVVSLKALQSTYFNTVGMNTVLRLNVPPATTGQFDTPDVTLLQDFGTWYSSLFKTNLAQGQPATADSTWAANGFGAARATDGDVCTYWAAAAGTSTARIEVTPIAPVTFSLISIREPIELGERTTAYHVEIKQRGVWNWAPTDASGARIQGTIIGQRQLWQLEPTTADAVALVIDAAKDVPAIAEFGLY